jgi:hypothetical protein
MTSKHSAPEYQRNARIIRGRVRTMHRRGESVPCWRCRRAILPGQPFDVGHRDPNGGHGLDNLAPEHRHKTASCVGNRADGGRMGAAITNHRPAARDVQTWEL